MTDSRQLNSALRHNASTRRYFLGCYPSDRIPKSNVFPYCVIVNTDDSKSPGQHWVAMNVLSPARVEYFDSLGVWPPSVASIHTFLNGFEHCSHITTPLQSAYSGCCGKYAVYFLLRRFRDAQSFDSIVEHLRQCKTLPDRLVSAYVNRTFRDVFNI
jgi:hypothetical protein